MLFEDKGILGSRMGSNFGWSDKRRFDLGYWGWGWGRLISRKRGGLLVLLRFSDEYLE